MKIFYASISSMHLTLGVDAGGTTTRALLTGDSGLPVARGFGDPGNPATFGATAALHIGAAIRAALRGYHTADVTAAVVGLAGISGLAGPGVAEAFADEWTSLGLTCNIKIVGDAVTAFASATEARTGTVLIAGTGAVAAYIDDYHIVRTADGLGWLLGDRGSGLWLGLQAVKAAARDLTTPLAQAIAAQARASTTDALIAWATRVPPTTFASLAPLVCTSDDPVAADLTAKAAAHLIATFDELDPPPAGPVILAGGLLSTETPVQAAVLSCLRNRGINPHVAVDPAWGAIRLAAAA
jgi:N-acetylglucosamine kinase-like BadF-type ATPase